MNTKNVNSNKKLHISERGNEMGLLEFATENEKNGRKIRRFSARIVRVWLKLRADRLEKRLARRQIPVPEDHGEVWKRVREEITRAK